MNFFVWFLLQVAVVALTPTPKLPGAKRPELESLSIPTATEDRVQAYGVGTFRVAGNWIWYGDYKPYAVTKKVRVNLFKKKSQTTGWRIHAGLWASLLAVPADMLKEIRVGDRVVWSGTVVLSKSAPTSVPVDFSWTDQEGQEVANGIKGTFIFYNHRVRDLSTYTRLPNDYMDGQLGGAGAAPGYPNGLHVVWLGPSQPGRPGFVSISNAIEPISFTLHRLPDVQDALLEERAGPSYFGYYDPQYLQDDLGFGGGTGAGDANIPLEILELLTTRNPGLGPRLSPWAVDLASIVECAERLQYEGNGVSRANEQTRPLKEIIYELLAQAAATIDIDPTTGRLKMRLIRSDEAVKASFSNGNIIEIQSFTRQTNATPANEVHVPFLDRDNNWVERVAIATDPAGVRLAGGPVVVERVFPGVTNAALAAQLASRELRVLSSHLARIRFSGFTSGIVVLQPGDLITVSHSDLGQNNLRFRVASARFADMNDRRRIDIEAVEDVFLDGIGSVTVSPVPLPDVSVPPTSVVGSYLMAPFALTGSDADRLMFIAEDPGTQTATYQLAIQENTTTWRADESEEYAEDTQEPAITGTLATATASTATTLVINLSSAAAQQFGSAYRGTLLMLAGNDEWLECSQWALAGNVLTATGAARGVFDSVPGAWSAGTAVRVLLGYSIDESDLKTLPVAGAAVLAGVGSLVARADSYGAGGVLRAAETGASASQVVWSYSGAEGRAFKPLPVAAVELGGVVGGMAEAEAVAVARADSLALGWKYRNRLARQTAPYWATDSNQEAGSSADYVVEYKSGGAWVGVVAGNSGGTGVAVDATGLPAGVAVTVRARMTTRRSGATARVPAVAYWTVSA